MKDGLHHPSPTNIGILDWTHASMRTCAFCGEKFKGKTKDHVPPRCLFGAAADLNLMTVPACKDCNNGSSDDDEFFRLLALEVEASKTPAASSVVEGALRSLDLPEKWRFAQNFYGGLRTKEMPGSDGSEPEIQWTFTMPPERVQRTTTKVIKGLYYRMRKKPVPEGYDARTYWVESRIRTLSIPNLVRFRDVVVNRLLPTPVTEKGDVFAYWSDPMSATDPDEVHFLLCFYRRFFFYGHVAPKE